MQDDINFSAYSSTDLIQALGIEKFPPLEQGKIMTKFGELLFKRLLLQLPDTDMAQAINEITSLPFDEGLVRLIAVLDEKLPNAVEIKQNIFTDMISQFSVKS